MNVLSLFDGMSCGQIALKNLGVKVDNYYASEIDKYAIKIAKKNFPDMIHVGDVTQVESKHFGADGFNTKIDLIMKHPEMQYWLPRSYPQMSLRIVERNQYHRPYRPESRLG